MSIGCAGLLTQSRLHAENSTVDRSEIISGIEQAQSLVKMQKPAQAIERLVNAYNLADKSQDYIGSATLTYLIGEIYEHSGRLQQALIQYEQGLTILANRQAGATRILEHALADLRGSEKAYTPGGGTPIGTDLYRGEVAYPGRRLKQEPQALEGDIAIALAMNAGNMYLTQNQYPQATGLYEKALKMARNSHQPAMAARIQANLAWSAIKQRRFGEADAWLKSVLGEIDAKGDLLEARRALLALGVQYRETGNLPGAISVLNKALALYERAGDHAGRCRTLAHLATAHLQQEDLQQARDHYLRALELNRQVNDTITAWHANGGLAKTYLKLGDLRAAVLHYEKYMAAVDRQSRGYQTDQGKVAILESHAALTGEYVNASLDLAGRTGDYAHVRKAVERGRGRAFKGLLAAKQMRRRRIPGQLAAGPILYGDKWPHYQYEYADYIASQSAEGVSASPMAQMALGVGVQPSLPPSEEEGPDPRFWAAVKPPPATFLQTFVLPDRMVVLVNSLDAVIGGAIIDIKSTDLSDMVAGYRRAMNVDRPRGVAIASGALAVSTAADEGQPDEAKLSRKLYDLLIKPIEDLLPTNPREPLVIIPHQALWLLPFAALRDTRNRFFSDRHILTYAVSESTWTMLASRERSNDHRSPKAWIVGNPQMPARIEGCKSTFAMEELHGAEKEAGEIARLFQDPKNAELYTRLQADRLRLDAWHPDFSVLHFATHGLGCAADPLSSFIVLKALASSEIELDLNLESLSVKSDSRYPVTLAGARKMLQSQVMPKPDKITYPGLLDARTIITRFDLDADLVTLSACQTGLGQLTGEGLVGFTRAFLAAGARSLLVSLWRVDDISTRDLMVNFYREYLAHGQKGLALQRAMAITRQQFDKPRYWAGFTLVGLAE